MKLTATIKEIVHGVQVGEVLAFDEAHELYSAMLDGGVPELELGAILAALQMKKEGLSELLGFYEALNERLYHLYSPVEGLRTVVLPSYYGTFQEANLVPLLALWLRKLGVPVLMHGSLEANGRVASAYVLRALGMMPCASLAQAQLALNNDKFAFVPTAALSPGLATLLGLRSRLGIRNTAHTLAAVIDPFAGNSLRVIGASSHESLVMMGDFMLAAGGSALLLSNADGEPVVDPVKRPKMELFSNCERQTLFEEEAGAVRSLNNVPQYFDDKSTAIWTRQLLAGESSLPLPLVNQLACCLYGAGMTDDLIQAKAIVAVETGSLSAV